MQVRLSCALADNRGMQPRNRPLRPRTYVIRGGRMSASSKRKLSELLPRYAAADADFALLDGRPLEVEIGCGKGEAVIHYAQTKPASLQIAFEVYRQRSPPCWRACTSPICRMSG